MKIENSAKYKKSKKPYEMCNTSGVTSSLSTEIMAWEIDLIIKWVRLLNVKRWWWKLLTKIIEWVVLIVGMKTISMNSDPFITGV